MKRWLISVANFLGCVAAYVGTVIAVGVLFGVVGIVVMDAVRGPALEPPGDFQ